MRVEILPDPSPPSFPPSSTSPTSSVPVILTSAPLPPSTMPQTTLMDYAKSEAATVIQAVFRGFYERTEPGDDVVGGGGVKMPLEGIARDVGAEVIQGLWRGFKIRNNSSSSLVKTGGNFFEEGGKEVVKDVVKEAVEEAVKGISMNEGQEEKKDDHAVVEPPVEVVVEEEKVEPEKPEKVKHAEISPSPAKVKHAKVAPSPTKSTDVEVSTLVEAATMPQVNKAESPTIPIQPQFTEQPKALSLVEAATMPQINKAESPTIPIQPQFTEQPKALPPPVAFPMHTSPTTPYTQVVLLAHAQAFDKDKSNPVSLSSTEVVKILQALNLVKGRELERMMSTSGMRGMQGYNDKFNVDLSGTVKELKRSLIKAWSNLEKGTGGNKKIPSNLAKQTKKHLTDLLRLPKPALTFLQDLSIPIKELSTSDMSTFFSHLGVKTPQYHRATALHLNGSNFGKLNEAKLEDQEQKNVLRSSLLRRRILLAISVLKIISQFQSALSYSRAVSLQKPNAASSSPNPKTGEDGPFSGIVEELRKSVGELQMTLYSRDNTIRGLNEKVAKITKRAEQAGLILSPSPPKEDSVPVTSTGRRALYRDEAVDLSPSSPHLTVLPPPKGQEGSPMVHVSKGMWEDPRVYSPAKGEREKVEVGVEVEDQKCVRKGGVGNGKLRDSWENRKALPMSQSTFDPTGMGVGVTNLGRFNEEISTSSGNFVPPSPPRKNVKTQVTPDLGFELEVGKKGLGGSQVPEGKMMNFIRKGSPSKRRPNSSSGGAGSNSNGNGNGGSGVSMPQFAKGTSVKGKAVLRSVWLDFMADGREGGEEERRKKKRGRRGKKGKISVLAGRTFGGTEEARRIIEGNASEEEEDGEQGKQRKGMDGGDDLDELVRGDYLREYYDDIEESERIARDNIEVGEVGGDGGGNEENEGERGGGVEGGEESDDSWGLQAGEERGGRKKYQRLVGRPKSGRPKSASSKAPPRKENDKSRSPLSPCPPSPGALGQRINKINRDVGRARERLKKQLKGLRGHSMERDPKSSKEVIEEVRRKKAKAARGGGKRGGKVSKQGPIGSATWIDWKQKENEIRVEGEGKGD